MRNCSVFQGLQFVCLLATLLLGGCGGSSDGRLVQLSEEASNRQAEQNKAMAKQSQETAEATKSLVAADAKARQELTALQHRLRADQAQIGQQRDVLELERKQIASERKWDRLLAPVLTDFGIFMVITAALAFCWYLLIGLKHEKNTESAVEEILIEELVSDNPRLLPTLPSSPPVLHYQPHTEIEDASSASTESET